MKPSDPDAKGFVDHDTVAWLNAANAPRWTEFKDDEPSTATFDFELDDIEGDFDFAPPEDGGNRYGSTLPQPERWGTDWMVDAIEEGIRTAVHPIDTGVVATRSWLVFGLSTVDGQSSLTFRDENDPGRQHQTGFEIDFFIPADARVSTNDGELNDHEQEVITLVSALQTAAVDTGHGLEIVEVVTAHPDLNNAVENTLNISANDNNGHAAEHIDTLHIEFGFIGDAPDNLSQDALDAIQDGAAAVDAVMEDVSASHNHKIAALGLDFFEIPPPETNISQLVTNYLDNDDTPTFSELVAALNDDPNIEAQSVGDDDPGRMAFCINFSAQNASITGLDLDSPLDDLGVSIDLSSVEFPALATLNIVTTIGVDFDLGSTASEAGFVSFDNLDFDIQINPDGLSFPNLPINIGFLGGKVGDGLFGLNAKLDGDFNNGPNGFLSLGELATTPLSDFLTLSNVSPDIDPSVTWLNFDFPITISDALIPGSARIYIEDFNPFGTIQASDLNVDLPEGVSGFSGISATELAGVFTQFTNWLDLFGASNAFAASFPFSVSSLGDLLSFGGLFRDQVTSLLETDANLPTFDTAQQLGELLADVAHLRFDEDHNCVDGPALLFDFSLPNTYVDPMQVDLDLDLLGSNSDGGLANVRTDGTATIQPELGLELTFGISLMGLTSVSTDTYLKDLSGGRGIMVVDDGVADLEIELRDGTTVEVNFDSLVDDATGALLEDKRIRDVLDLFDVPGSLSSSLDNGRIVLTDLTTPTGTLPVFNVSGVNQSMTGLALGITGQDDDADGVIEGEILRAEMFEDLVFIEDASLTAGLNFLAEDVTADAQFGPLALGIADGDTIESQGAFGAST